MNLPVIGEWIAARLTKANEATRARPIVASTAPALSGGREGLGGGRDGYHPKPIEFSHLLARIDALTVPPAWVDG